MLPTWTTEEEDIPDHLTHMMECPYVMQMALLLMMPKWHCPALQPMAWSAQEHISAVRRQHALQKWQLHAGISDTFGLSLETVAQFGLQMMQDPLIADTIRYRCMLCGRCFYMAQSFEHHLHRARNFLQMQTLMCYHRLTLHGGSKCQILWFHTHLRSLNSTAESCGVFAKRIWDQRSRKASTRHRRYGGTCSTRNS